MPMAGMRRMKAAPYAPSRSRIKEQVLALARNSIFQGFDLKELVDGIESFWSDKERRNRSIHDEWYVGFYEEGNFPRNPESGEFRVIPVPVQIDLMI
jgi:hypothetical protein